MKQRKQKSVFREYTESIVIAILLAVIMRHFVVQAFKIPSGSMEQTLLIGDHILVNKFLYRFTAPRRFDVFVFEYPWETNRDFIKRLIALPGDRVQVLNHHVYINERALQEPYVYYSSMPAREGDFGPLVVPKKGDTIEIRADQQLYLNGQRLTIPAGRFYPHDHGPAMTGFEVFYAKLFPAGTTLNRPTGPRVVQHNYYFALGDHRDNSKDSRYWGFVEDSLIEGKAFFIYWSWNRYGRFVDHVRWERLGKLLQLAPGGRFAVSR